MENSELILENIVITGEAYYRPDKNDCGEVASAYIAALEARIAMLIRADAANTMAICAGLK